MKVERRSRLPATSKVAKNSHVNSSSLMVLLRVPKEKRAKTISAEEWVRLPYGRQLSWRLVYSRVSILLIPLGVYTKTLSFKPELRCISAIYMLESHSGRLGLPCKQERKPRRFESDLQLGYMSKPSRGVTVFTNYSNIREGSRLIMAYIY